MFTEGAAFFPPEKLTLTQNQGHSICPSASTGKVTHSFYMTAVVAGRTR